jgi:hypothetical protein
VFACNGSYAVIEPASAGTIVNFECQGIGCSPNVCVVWSTPGYHNIKVYYDCAFYTETRTRTVYVSLDFVDYAQFSLSAISNCPSPNSSFTINRSSVNRGPVKNHRILVYEIDANNNPLNPPVYDSGWLGGDITSKTINSNNNGLNFQVGKRYKVRFQTQSACGTDDIIGSTIITGSAFINPVADFNINGSQSTPVDLFTCNNSPMIMNDATTFPGCNPNISVAVIQIEKATDCNTSISGTLLQQTVSYAPSYNLRTLFPTYANTSGFYRIKYYILGNAGGFFSSPTRCVRVNSQDPSNAEFKLIPPSGVPLNRSSDPNAANAELGQLTCGLTVDGQISQLGSIDGYKIQIWRTDADGIIQETIFNPPNFTTVDANNPLPLTRVFNSAEVANGYFLGLSQQQVTDYRFKVRLTVVNECGESFQESFFRIKPNCQFCLVDNGGNGNSAQYSDAESFALRLNPNPVQEQLNVQFDLRKEGMMQFGLFDANARQVLTFQRDVSQIGDNFTEIFDVAHLPAGVYFWQMGYAGQNVSGKIIKN